MSHLKGEDTFLRMFTLHDLVVKTNPLCIGQGLDLHFGIMTAGIS